MKSNRQSSEYENDTKRNPEHGLGLFPFQKDGKHLHQGSDNRHRRCGQNRGLCDVERARKKCIQGIGTRLRICTGEFKRCEEQNDGEKVE